MGAPFGYLIGTSENTVVLAPISVNATFDSTAIDRKNWGAVYLTLSLGVVGTAFAADKYYTFILEDSDDNSTFTAVTDATAVHGTFEDIATGLIVKVDDATAHDNLAYPVEYVGKKRYVRIAAVKVSTPDATIMGINTISHTPSMAGTTGLLGSN